MHSLLTQIRTKPSPPSWLFTRILQRKQKNLCSPPLHRKPRLVLRQSPPIAPARNVVHDRASHAGVLDARFAVAGHEAERVGFGGGGRGGDEEVAEEGADVLVVGVEDGVVEGGSVGGGGWD